MELTPIGLRGVLVSSGDGAKPHGRDTSRSTTKTTPTDAAAPPRTDRIEHEVPVDLLAETVAASLRRADPHLDPKLAARIAKELLTRPVATHWETSPQATDGGGEQRHVDLQA